ncbi:MAG: c-type cytochrome [Gaiellaceae bacterium]
MTPRSRLRFPLLGLVLALTGCGGNQNVVHPESHQEHEIAKLFWALLVASSLGFALVVCLLFLGWLRRTKAELPGGIGEGGATKLVIGLGVALPIALLSILFVWSDFFVMRSTAAPATGSSAMTIHVTGHDWWWEVRYDGTPVVTANEIHIPARTRVTVVGATADVIHSFWVPELNRKIDLVPGYTNRVLLEANRPGRYRGQCAEFCGLQHAHMAVLVVAEPMAAFRRWLAANARPAAAKAPAVFARGGCADCHQIRGTDAHGDVGPDLTHVASRLTLAANTIPNTPQYLAGWIRDPQHFKPGNRMPNLHLSDADWRALASYLRTLR